jgi:hypothetical protein
LAHQSVSTSITGMADIRTGVARLEPGPRTRQPALPLCQSRCGHHRFRDDRQGAGTRTGRLGMQRPGSSTRHNRPVGLRKITTGGLFVAAATLAACSSSPSPQARATAEACGVFAGHAGTNRSKWPRRRVGDLWDRATRVWSTAPGRRMPARHFGAFVVPPSPYTPRRAGARGVGTPACVSPRPPGARGANGPSGQPSLTAC